MTRSTLIKIGALTSTIVLSWLALSWGVNDTVGPQVGGIADREYVARKSVQVEDAVATEAERKTRSDQVAAILRTDTQVQDDAFTALDKVFADVTQATEPVQARLEQVPEPTTSTSTSSTTAAPDASTTTTVAEVVADKSSITGFLFADVNRDGVYQDETPENGWRPDVPLAGVDVVAVAGDGSQFTATSGADGLFSIEVPQGSYEVIVDPDSRGFPTGFTDSTEVTRTSQTVDCTDADCPVEPIALSANIPLSFEGRVQQLSAQYPLITTDTLTTLAEYAERDLYRRLVAGQGSLLDTIDQEANRRLSTLFTVGVTSENLQDVKVSASKDRIPVLIDNQASEPALKAVNELVTQVVTPNRVLDVQATQAAKDAAAAQVEPVYKSYRVGDAIVLPGDEFTALTVDAINLAGANTDRRIRDSAMFAVLAVLVGVLGYYLARFRHNYWKKPRLVALFGMLIVLAAGSVRLVSSFENTTPYVLPAVAFGYLASVLFDNRMGTLMALAMAVLAAVGTGDPGVAVFGGLATLAPIGFVSAVSSRRAFRNSVIVSGVTAAAIAAVCSWYFQPATTANLVVQVRDDALFAGIVSLFASLVALAAMPFFESMFDITTTLRLLELTDRNHEALQLLQEKAFGTFNHSLMVGTLADAAARAIGANNLLARAAAYYHDLGKTENPSYFIENQFGAVNPHDELAPEESAQLIRRHVLDGVELARKHNIPSEVAEGIVSHHGDGIMRFFYEKARQEYGADSVSPETYRHAGHKPQSREMAILMMADAVEGACRAVFAEEEPKPESVAKVVNRVVDEKVADDQLSQCDLTLGELTKVRQAFIDALTGHYHQRIPYPNFPGS